MVNDKNRRARQAGFTLIELIVVMTVVGLLAALATINVRNARVRAEENALKYNLAQIRKAIDDYYADKQVYPPSLDDLVPNYMRKLPVDPITKSSDTWQIVYEETDPNASDWSSEYKPPGVYDVKSGAEGQTHDDPPVPYSEL